MRKTTVIAVLALQSHAFCCSGLAPCPDAGEMKDPERIEILRQRISASPDVFLVLPSVKDTLKVSLASGSDSICSVDFRIERYWSELVPLVGMKGGKKALVRRDTLGWRPSCPNPDCIRAYTCVLPEAIR